MHVGMLYAFYLEKYEFFTKILCYHLQHFLLYTSMWQILFTKVKKIDRSISDKNLL